MASCTALGVALAVGGEAGEAATVSGNPGVGVVGQGAEEGKLVQAEEPGPVEGDSQGGQDGARASEADAVGVHRPGGLLSLGVGQAQPAGRARLLERREPEPMARVQALHERRAERSEVSGAVEEERQRRVEVAHQYGPLKVLTWA